MFQIPIGAQNVSGNEKIEIFIPTPLELKVGDLSASRKLFLALDLSHISEKAGRQIHGIIGHNFIRDNIIQINYHSRTITFYPQHKNPYSRAEIIAAELDLEFIDEGTFPLITDLAINGKKIRSTIDTGSNKSITLFNQAVDYLNLNISDAVEIEAVGYGGVNEFKQIKNIDITIGGLELTDQIVYCDLNSVKADVSLDIRGANIGNTLLKNFIVTMDYKSQKIWFKVN